MKQTKTEFIKFTKVLTNDDILTYAKNIGEIRKKIDEAEAAKNKLRGLNYEMGQITKILEQGEISEHCRATFSFHDPEENMVTITPPSMVTRFEPIIREMTPEEKEKYCQHTLEFEEPEEEEETEPEEGVHENTFPEYDNVELTEENKMEQSVYQCAKDGDYFKIGDSGKRVYLTIDSESEHVIFFKDPVWGVGLGKKKKDIKIVTEAIPTDHDQKTDEEEDDGLYIDNYRNQVFYVRPKNDKSRLVSYYHDKNKAERFIELYKIHQDAEKVREIIHNEQEHLLNSTGNYDMIENEDGSIKEESDK